jgi:phosphoglycolate phosphatase
MHIIFDFDGTLVDSFDVMLEKFNLLADTFKYRKVKLEEIPTLKNLNSREFIQFLEIPLYKIPRVLAAARKSIRDNMQGLASFPDLPGILQQLHAKGFTLGILTSNSEENVSTWLTLQKLDHLFQFIHHKSSLFGKKQILKKIIRQLNMNKTKTVYIGDETRDVEAAKLNNIHSIAVTWGFNSETALQTYQPDFIARLPRDILEICEKINSNS